jgi:hypothetical protein
MTEFVHLTTAEGTEIYINPDVVAWVLPAENSPNESALVLRDPTGVGERDHLTIRGEASAIAMALRKGVARW